MQWNTRTGDARGFALIDVTEGDIQKLWNLRPDCSWEDCRAFLNRATSMLFESKQDIEALFIEFANGEYGNIEGCCEAQEGRHF